MRRNSNYVKICAHPNVLDYFLSFSSKSYATQQKVPLNLDDYMFYVYNNYIHVIYISHYTYSHIKYILNRSVPKFKKYRKKEIATKCTYISDILSEENNFNSILFYDVFEIHLNFKHNILNLKVKFVLTINQSPYHPIIIYMQ